jgi:hypothetical protein
VVLRVEDVEDGTAIGSEGAIEVVARKDIVERDIDDTTEDAGQ